MAKAKTGQLVPQAPPKQRGVMNFRNTEQGVVIQKWPRPRGRGVTPYRWYIEQQFLIAARWASDSDPLDIDTAKNLTEGCLYIWRDAIVRSMYGNFIRIVTEDGTIIPTNAEVAQNAQLILDQVTGDVGSILVRAPIGWVGLPIGNVGQFLAAGGLLPEYQDGGGGGGTAAGIIAPAHLNPGSLTSQSASYVQGTMATVNPDDKPNCIQFFAGAAVAGSQNTPAVYTNNGNTGGALLETGPTVTGVVQGINTLPLDGELVVAAPTFLYVGIHTKVSGFSTPTAPGLPDWYMFAAGAMPNPLSGIVQGSNTALAHCWLARL